MTRGDISQTIEATGTIKPSNLVGVGAQASGRIERLNVKLGDHVAAGDLIAEIDSRTQRNALTKAQAALENARANRQVQVANLREYELAHARQRTMLAADATSQADYDSAKARLESTRAQIKALDADIAQQQTEVANARTNLEYTKITAPITGTVLSVVSKQGQTVNAALSTPTIVMLGDLSTMTVYAEVSEADVVHTQVGQEVYFTILGKPGQRYTSQLRDIAPAPESVVDEESSSTSSATDLAVYYHGLFDVSNPKGDLRTYMTAHVSIVMDKASGVLIIPSAALSDDVEGGRHTVRVLDDSDRPHERTVLIGLDNGAEVEVQEGLQEGERVVIGEANNADSKLAQNSPAPAGMPAPPL